jgi:hypothetical protein
VNPSNMLACLFVLLRLVSVILERIRWREGTVDLCTFRTEPRTQVQIHWQFCAGITQDDLSSDFMTSLMLFVPFARGLNQTS